MNKIRVGDTIKCNLLVARIHKWKGYQDLEVINKDTGENGSIRVLDDKDNPYDKLYNIECVHNVLKWKHCEKCKKLREERE